MYSSHVLVTCSTQTDGACMLSVGTSATVSSTEVIQKRFHPRGFVGFCEACTEGRVTSMCLYQSTLFFFFFVFFCFVLLALCVVFSYVVSYNVVSYNRVYSTGLICASLMLLYLIKSLQYLICFIVSLSFAFLCHVLHLLGIRYQVSAMCRYVVSYTEDTSYFLVWCIYFVCPVVLICIMVYLQAVVRCYPSSGIPALHQPPGTYPPGRRTLTRPHTTVRPLLVHHLYLYKNNFKYIFKAQTT